MSLIKQYADSSSEEFHDLGIKEFRHYEVQNGQPQ